MREGKIVQAKQLRVEASNTGMQVRKIKCAVSQFTYLQICSNLKCSQKANGSNLVYVHDVTYFNLSHHDILITDTRE